MKPDSKVALRETAEKISDKTKALFVKHHGIMHGPSFRRLLTAELAEFRKEVLRAEVVPFIQKHVNCTASDYEPCTMAEQLARHFGRLAEGKEE